MRSLLQNLIRKYDKEVDYLEVRVEESESTAIGFSGRSTDIISQSIEKGGCVRALIKGGWGFSSFNQIDEDNLEHHIRSAIKQAGLIGDEQSQLADVECVDKVIPLNVIADPRDVSLDQKVGILKSYNEMILQSDPQIQSSRVGYRDKYAKIYFSTTEGTYLEQEKIDVSGSLMPIAIKNGQSQQSSVGFGSSTDFRVVKGLERKLSDAIDEYCGIFLKNAIFPFDCLKHPK